MSAHLEVPALESESRLPASLSHAILTQLLRQEMGFEGVIITDGLGMVGVTKYHNPGELEVKALQAGNDILLCPVDVPKAIEAIKQAVLDGRFPEDELDKRVLKVLACKTWAQAENALPVFDRQLFFSESAQALQQKIVAHATAF